MYGNLNNLSEYVTPDIEKRQLIDKLLPGTVFHSRKQFFAEEIVLKQMEMHDVC